MTHLLMRSAAVGIVAALSACAVVAPPPAAPRKETVVALTSGQRLLSFNAGQPQRIVQARAVGGLAAGERLVGIDYRVARGQLFALANSGRLYRLNPATGAATAVGEAPAALALDGVEFGVDFNPVVDRIRVVSDRGQNLRLHPDSGAAVDADAAAPGVQPDAPLRFAAGDANAGVSPRVVAAAYTYNKQNDKITTNYAIEASRGLLVTQGSLEGATPAVSPNSGQLFTVGALGIGAFERAAFDIADTTGAAFVAATRAGAATTQWYLVDLASGRARLLGDIAGGETILGVAIEP